MPKGGPCPPAPCRGTGTGTGRGPRLASARLHLIGFGGILATILLALTLQHPGVYSHGGRGRPAVYDVEVREVDSAQLSQILRNTPSQQVFVGGPGGLRPLAGQWQNQGQQQGPQQWPQGQGPRPGQGPPPGVGMGQANAHFVSPSGQVYSLKTVNGQPVLVGPDGRWHPLNQNGNGAGPAQGQHQGYGGGGGGDEDTTHPEPDQGLNGDRSNQGGDGDDEYQGPDATYRPSSGPSYGDDAPKYDRADGAPKGTRDAEDCVSSVTTYNKGKRACRYQLLFEDNFNTFNLTKWTHDVFMPAEPDFEFVAYDKDPDNSYVKNGTLVIKPTMMEDTYGEGFVMNGTLDLDGCTETRRELCSRTATTYRVLPAVRSARITSKKSFSFRYGIVEARVLVPQGDWIYPAMTLEPASEEYGRWYAGGQIRMPGALGNRFLTHKHDGPWQGLQVLRAGVALGLTPGEEITPTVIEQLERAPKKTNWRRKGFRVFRTKWTPDYIEYSLDGKPIGRTEPPPGGFVSMLDAPGDHPWKTGSKMAPFDQEFFLSIGVGVGGVNRFPDTGTNGEFSEHPKPWKNSSPKAALDFWKGHDHWIPTWLHPALEVTYIRVWAL